MLAIDLLESPGCLLVNEINSTMEFRNSVPTGVDIPDRVVDYVLDVARNGVTAERPLSEPIPAAIVGGSGYTGGELLRLLLAHPGVR